ncbi:hypothetical protein ACIBI9_32005 [Nonomuraea sp. NPDC050451]|uniref:hypothetical protein n=1 Tax=Nonomuraea sp. NPDC050451 TaxID=3364364 RepID=UPI00379E5F6B
MRTGARSRPTLRALPASSAGRRLPSIPGAPPDPAHLPKGRPFRLSEDVCAQEAPELSPRGVGHCRHQRGGLGIGPHRGRFVEIGDADRATGCRFRTRCPIGPLKRPGRTVCVEQAPERTPAATGQPAACHFAGDPAATGAVA